MFTSIATQPSMIRRDAMARIEESDRRRFSQWAAIVACGFWVWSRGGLLIMWVWILQLTLISALPYSAYNYYFAGQNFR